MGHRLPGGGRFFGPLACRMEWRKALSPVLKRVKVVKHSSQIPPCTFEALAPGTLTASGEEPPSNLPPLLWVQPAAASSAWEPALASALGLVRRSLGWIL